jgi:hypothetical protein
MDQALENDTAMTPIDRTADGTPYEEPQGEAEQAMATVWREVFGFDRIGRNDNFFELGGNSLLGMELTETLDERLGIQLPVVTLFLNPTIREITEVAARPAAP